MLGHLFGYSHITTDQEEYEKYTDRTNSIFYSERRIDTNELYTLGELKRMKVHWPNEWIKTDQVTDKNVALYRTNSVYKRGFMVKTQGIITFSKCTLSVTNAESFE